MKALGLVLALSIAATAPAQAWFWHKKEVPVEKVEMVNGVPVGVKTVKAKEPEGMGKVIMRSTGVSLAVTGVVTAFKIGLFVVTGVPVF